MTAAHDPKTGKLDVEHLSALMDGELEPQQADAVVDALCRDPELQRRWSDLQLVGDALRSTEVAACHVEGFCARVARALVHEPTVLAPRRARVSLRRYVVPGVAVAASVAAIAFVALPLLQEPAPQIATRDATPATEVTARAAPAPAPAAPRDAAAASPQAAAAIANARALDAYFAAHRELTGGTPLPRATAYLRTGAGEP